MKTGEGGTSYRNQVEEYSMLKNHRLGKVKRRSDILATTCGGESSAVVEFFHHGLEERKIFRNLSLIVFPAIQCLRVDRLVDGFVGRRVDAAFLEMGAVIFDSLIPREIHPLEQS